MSSPKTPPRSPRTPRSPRPYIPRLHTHNLRPRNLYGLISPSQKYSPTLTLRQFPPELREMIFKNSLIRKEGKTPALLIALRGDTGLYAEGLRVYYMINEFELPWNGKMKGGVGGQEAWKWFEDLGEDVKKMVRGGIRVVLPKSNLDDLNMTEHLKIIAAHVSAVQKLPNVTSLTFLAQDRESLMAACIQPYLALLGLQDFNLQTLRMLVGGNSFKLRSVAMVMDWVYLAAARRYFEYILGKSQKTVFARSQKWVWECEKGKKLFFNSGKMGTDMVREALKEVAKEVSEMILELLN